MSLSRISCGRPGLEVTFSYYPALAMLRPAGESDTGGVAGDRVDFFISHADSDRAWAEWVAWQLTEAGYAVELDVWDWPAGQNFVTAISDALDRYARVVALFSAAYVDRSRYNTIEWSAAALRAPGMTEGRLVTRHELAVPPEAAATFRALSTLEGGLTLLAPGFDIVAEAQALR